MQAAEFVCNVTQSDFNRQRKFLSLTHSSFIFHRIDFCLAQLGQFHASLSQYYTQEWLLYYWIGTFPLTSGLSSCTLNTDFQIQESFWHHLLESVGISNKCLMACAQRDTPKPGRMWQITNASRPTPLSSLAHRKYISLHLVWVE